MKLVAFLLLLIAVYFVVLCIRAWLSPVGKELTGTAEGLRLTWGQQGQQIVTIDGCDYNIWLDYKEFWKVDRGNVIRHIPYWDRSMGRKLLSTKIIDVKNDFSANKKKKNAAQTQPGSRVPT